MINKSEYLTPSQIQKKVFKKIEKYEKLNFFEKYAMFMGKAQILEFGLKKLLEEKFNYELGITEKWTLGRITRELEKNMLRDDFVYLLKSVLEFRNYTAHELFVNRAIVSSSINNKKTFKNFSKDQRQLDKAIIELEQLIFLFDRTNKHGNWV